MVLLEQKYKEECIPALMERYGYKNPFQVPRIEKVSLNMGLGEAIQNPKLLDAAVEELTLIAGQRAVVTRAKKSIAAFKVRAGMPIGCRVTLRKQRMWDFLTKLIHLAIPRVRDFRGISRKAFDGKGNYTLGIKEHIIFPEIDYDKVDKVKGLNCTIVTTAKTDEEALVLLETLGMPFRK
ncbi:LSU ribosomal protein L5p (L11e) [Dissulfuribacter thermophilus]|uniref:Large ribosomal subunit protein uL5 n=1 Tax=Dissulfuribacter thermophilus TaxID=1156395 RepID=A0A1B9F525_9BACT|nr:50S ribosomal protein L5 [Dissulfuribacter thermophilus]OCC15059.1 LSU ribosomal protein L5p (L11e) [Dissulfuribacter thermophilus]